MRFAVVCLFGLLAPLNAQEAARQDEITPEEQAAIERRELWKTGEFEITSDAYEFDRQGNASLIQHKTGHVWFDGDRARSDVVSAPGSRLVQVVDGERQIFWTDQIADARPIAMTIRSREPTDRWPAFLPDLRLLGFACIGGWEGSSPRGLRSQVGYVPRTDLVRTEEQIDGVNAVRIEFHPLKHMTYRIWIAPELDDSVIKVEIDEGGGASRTVSSVESEVERDEGSGLYYPKHVTFRYLHEGTLAGKEFFQKQLGDVTVRLIQLNRPLRSDTFNLSGLRLPKDIAVLDWTLESDQEKRWDGRALVPFVRAGINPAEPSSWKWILLINAAVLVAIGLALVAWSRRRAVR
jgi:hypothetical protein